MKKMYIFIYLHLYVLKRNLHTPPNFSLIKLSFIIGFFIKLLLYIKYIYYKKIKVYFPL